jgi:hypothetical protein
MSAAKNFLIRLRKSSTLLKYVEKKDFPPGTRVRLRFTGETGIVTSRLSDDMAQKSGSINDPDFIIPAFEEDIVSDTVLSNVAPRGQPRAKTDTARPACRQKPVPHP